MRQCWWATRLHCHWVSCQHKFKQLDLHIAQLTKCVIGVFQSFDLPQPLLLAHLGGVRCQQMAAASKQLCRDPWVMFWLPCPTVYSVRDYNRCWFCHDGLTTTSCNKFSVQCHWEKPMQLLPTTKKGQERHYGCSFVCALFFLNPFQKNCNVNLFLHKVQDFWLKVANALTTS